ncbi:MAG: Arc family DNA-binding protein [Pseudomonadota bacterium]
MANISIKDVPEAWAESLRQRAARNHRSLQGELMAIIEQAVEGTAAPLTSSTSPEQLPRTSAGQGTVAGHDRRGKAIMRYGWKTIEQISAEMKAKYPKPVQGAPLAVDIIREDRDSR